MTAARPILVNFVCWGNICRSPMAERIAEGQARDAGVADAEFVSSGVSTEELGNPIDRRAAAWLSEHGYRTEGHRAHQISRDEIDEADLVIAMEQLHIDRMLRTKPRRTDHIRLLSSFDPEAEKGSGVPDPWYGSAAGFADTGAALEAAMPGIFAEIKGLQSEKQAQADKHSPTEQ